MAAPHPRMHGLTHIPGGPDPLPGLSYAKTVQLKVVADDALLTVADAQLVFVISSDLGGLNLIDADAYVSTAPTSGTPTVQIRNVTRSAYMLSTRITIDAHEYTSYTAATPPVIDTGNDDVATGNLIAVDVHAAGVDAKGLGVVLRFG